MAQVKYEKIDRLLSQAQNYETGVEAEALVLKPVLTNNDQGIFEEPVGHISKDLARSLALYKEALVEIGNELDMGGQNEVLHEKAIATTSKISEIELELNNAIDEKENDASEKITRKTKKYELLKTEYEQAIKSLYKLNDTFNMSDFGNLKAKEAEKYGKSDKYGLVHQLESIHAYLNVLNNQDFDSSVEKLKAFSRIEDVTVSAGGATSYQNGIDNKQYKDTVDKLLTKYKSHLEGLKKVSDRYRIENIEEQAKHVDTFDLKHISTQDAMFKLVQQYKATQIFISTLENNDTNYSKLQECTKLLDKPEGQVIKMDREFGGWEVFKAVLSIISVIPALYQMHCKKSLAFWREEGEITHNKTAEILEESLPSSKPNM